MLALSARSGALAARIGPRLQMSVGPVLVGVGLALFARIGRSGDYLTEVLPAVLVFGFGLAINVAPLTSTVLAAVPAEHAGMASAVNNDVARAAALIAVAVLPAAGGLTGDAEMKARDWRDGDTRNMAEEMMELTLEAAVRTLFGTTLPGEAQQVGRAMTFLMRYSLRRARSPLRIPAGWPTPKNRRATKEFGFLDSLVYRIIEERKAQGNGHRHSDLLSMLMGAMDEDGTQMTPRQLRDETMTLFLAGHETTALTLSWTWYLLSQNPVAETRLHEELRGVLGERAPGVADLERLPYLSAVISEVLRMYPPAYIMARTSIAPSSFGGYDFPTGSTMMVSQWVMHRDARYFDDPDSFRPERWLDGLADRLPAGAYFPFGDGPRRCIGQGFALLESALVIGALAQRFRFELVPGTTVAPEPLVTLRPTNGIRMTIHAR